MAASRVEIRQAPDTSRGKRGYAGRVRRAVTQIGEPPAASSTYWSRPLPQVLAALDASPDGMTSAEAARRLQRLGPNSLTTRQKITRGRTFLRQLTSPIVMILLFATTVSAVVGDWIDAAIILAIVAGSAWLSASQEYRASAAVERLKAQVALKATVHRDGRPQTVVAETVVPGDVVLLSAGSLVPADGVLLDARDCFATEAVLTGETFPTEKRPGLVEATAPLAQRTNCVFMGTSVRSGTARVLIIRTGQQTVFGQVAHRLVLRPPETGFERGIRRLGYLLTEVMLVLVLAVFAINVFFHKPVLDSLLFSIALAVGLTPQLLPAIINVNLAHGAQRMAARGVIVRRLASIENFGSMDVLCTDKTGTLTEGVVRLAGAVDVSGRASEHVLRLASLNAAFQTGLANPLDEAILAAGHASSDRARKLDEIPYDFVRKRLSVVIDDGRGVRLITKGALTEVIRVCTHVLDGPEPVPLDPGHRDAILRLYEAYSGQGLRVLGVAVRSVDPRPAYSRDDETTMTFAGLLTFADPPKAGVTEVVADLAALGVELKIITGDNRLVAMHTAESIGLPVRGVLTGAGLNELRDEALWHQANRVTIFAEVDPNQKERIIRALQRTGRVVGYMGDGINDAPSLHAADVGISVDTAVDVAKEAADFVLLRRDLAVLREGITQGRTTFANTLKYVYMATSANFGNMFSMAGASLFLPFLPLLPKQILLINFLTDLPEMMIARDNVDETVVRRPRRWDVAGIRRFMLVFGPLSSVFDYLTFGALLWLARAGPSLFRAGWFVESVLSASLVIFVLRTPLPVTRSRPSRAMLAAAALVGAAAVLIPYSPLAGVLGFAPLPLPLLLALGAVTAAYLASAEFAKNIFSRGVYR